MTPSTNCWLLYRSDENFSGFYSGVRNYLQVDLQVAVVVHDLHGRARQHVRGPHQTRVAHLLAELDGTAQRRQLLPLRLRDPDGVEHARELEAVLGVVNGLGRGAQHLDLLPTCTNEMLEIKYLK